MPEIIACPNCQRRLHLPEAFHAETVQCPSCQTQFSAAEARARAIAGTALSSSTSPKVIPTLEQYVPGEDDDSARGYPGSRRPARLDRPGSAPPVTKKSSWAPWIILGVGLSVVVVVLIGCFSLAFFAPKRGGGGFGRAGLARQDQALAYRNEADALWSAAKLAEAAAAYRKALDLDPKDEKAFLGLVRSVPWDDDLSDVQMRFAKLDDPEANFEICAAACEERYFPLLLEQLVKAMRRVDPAYPPLDYYLALCKARTDQPEQAVVLFRSALDKPRNARRREDYVKGFMKAMASAGHFDEAYAAAPDARTAFRLLATQGMQTYQSDKLKRLIILHGKKHADDPLLPWYQAEVYVREGRYARADKTFVAALAHPPDDETLQLFRASRVLARYHTGHALDAYREIAPRQETFMQLLRLAFQDEKDDQLAALLDAHAKNEPDSIDVFTYRARLKIRQGHVDDGIRLFQAALAKPLAAEKREQILYEFFADLVNAGKAVEGYQAAPDANKAFTIIAEELWDQDRLEDLPRLIEAHRKREPADPWLDYYQGELHLEEKAWDKAAAILADGCKKAPPDAQDSFRQRYVFAMYKAGHGMQAYEESQERDQTFTQLAGLLVDDKKGAELETLIEAHRPQALPSDPEPYLYEARAKALLKQPAEATAYFRKACDLQPNDNLRAGYVTRFILAMAEAGYVKEAYLAAPDKAAAFQTLAANLVAPKKDKDLAALLELHRPGHDKEPWYQFYTGELHLLRGETEQAEKHFAAGLAAAPRLERWSLRNGLFRARVKAGKTVAAYQEHEPGARTFADLAEVCVEEKDAKQLQALIDAHRKADPDDNTLPAWEVEVKYLNQDYEGVLNLLAENPEDLFGRPPWRWKADDYRVRCLVKLKRTKDAIREAEAVAKKPTGSRMLLLLAHAAAGDVKQTIATLEKKRPQPYFLSSCYKDPDLGPILNSELFKEFREKFPEPTDEELRGGRVRDD